MRGYPQTPLRGIGPRLVFPGAGGMSHNSDGCACVKFRARTLFSGRLQWWEDEAVVLQPRARPPGPASDRRTPRREGVRRCPASGVRCLLHWASLRALPAPSDPTKDPLGKERVSSARGGFTPLPFWNKRGALERRSAGR